LAQDVGSVGLNRYLQIIYFRMMVNFLMLGVAWSLKVSDRVVEEYDMCSQDSEDLEERDRMQPWRVRAICNDENSERLEEYLQVSNRETLSLEQEIQYEGSGKCNKACKKKKADKRREQQALRDEKVKLRLVGSKLYQGKFCGQSDPVKTSGLPIATFRYGHNTSNNATELDLAFKSNKNCYDLDCTGRCDIVDPSVNFVCIADPNNKSETKATFSRLKATWFLKSECKPTDKVVASVNVVGGADGVYYYTPTEVKMVNSGSQDRFCFDASGERATQDDKNMEVQPEWTEGDYTYQYSAVSTQQLPVCPR